MKAAPFGLLLVAVLFLGLTSCAMSRDVLIEPGKGVVAIPSNLRMYRNSAMKRIAEQCPKGYEIVREEEVPIGRTVRGETEIEPDIFQGATITEDYSTYIRTEWRIYYVCK